VGYGSAERGDDLVFDYHVHSEFSVDCTVAMRDSCEAAIAAGVTEIAFTDHVEHQSTDMGFGYYRFADYMTSVEAVQAEFADRLTVLKGAEVDFHTDTAEQVGEFIAAHGRDYDFVIGSVHYGDDARIIFQDYFEAKTIDDVIYPYLDQLEAAVRTGWFDTLGHLDLPKRYLPKNLRVYDPGRYRERLTKLFLALIERDMAFEINTSGLRQTPMASMPGPSIVRWYVEAGGTMITTGTDSHATQTIGAGLAKTLDMLALCGITEIASFRGRQRSLIPIRELRTAPVGS
jgi:histidinol-phosphatase (PHP family)